MHHLQWQVPADYAGCQLGSFLRAQGVSATQLRRAKQVEGAIQCNGRSVYVNALLVPGDTISFYLPRRPTPSNVEPENLPLSVLWESEDYLVVDKPAGMVVHPTRGYKSGTLAAAYLYRCRQRGEEEVFRPISRLDKGTSGLVLLAKNAYAQSSYQPAGQKQYLALVQGCLHPAQGQVDAPIGFAAGSVIQRAVLAQGKPSQTLYRVVAAGGGHSLLLVRPLTGRTHQIRVHMASRGFPLAGDDLYGGSQRLLGRPALHCYTMNLPGQKGRRIAASLPSDMAQACGVLGLSPASLTGLLAEVADENL